MQQTNFQKKNFDDYYSSNIQSIFNIIKFAKNCNAKVINLSTISVYEINNQNFVVENQLDISNSKLGTTKFIGEKLFEMSSLNFINLRMPGVLTSNLKSKRPWLRTIISHIKKNKNIECYNLNKNFNNVIDIKEICRLINFIAKRKKISGTIIFLHLNQLNLKA